MPYFHPIYTSTPADSAFNSLFQFLDNYGNLACEAGNARAIKEKDSSNSKAVGAQQPQSQQRNSLTSLAAFRPRFDVRETETAYELHGELPGVDRENVTIEFTEPQSLVVSGFVERNYSRSSNGSNNAKSSSTEGVIGMSGALADDAFEVVANHDEAARPASPAHSSGSRTASPDRHTTVTDEATEAAKERGEALGVAVTEKPSAPATQQQQPAAKERYWVRERSVGQFQRTFNFAVPVDESAVRATLDHGILSVTVPKAKREARRIAIL